MSGFLAGALRSVGLDVHREFAQVAVWQDGLVWQAGKFPTTPSSLADWPARS
jgi:hypothetical protein